MKDYSRAIIDNIDTYFLVVDRDGKIISHSDGAPEWLRELDTSDTRFFPLKVSIELTDKCNLSCSYCYRNAGTGKGKYLKHPIEFLHNLSDRGIMWVEFTGGEPLLHPEIEPILNYAFENFNVVGLLTNGTLLNGRIFSILDENKDKAILQISLPTLNEKRFKEITGYNKLKKVKENIKKAGKFDFITRVGTVLIDNESITELKAITNFVHKCDINSYAPSYAVDIGRGEVLQHLSYQKVKKLYKIIWDLNEKFNNIVQLLEHPSPEDLLISEEKENMNCGAGWKSFVFDPERYSRPCPLFPPEFGSNAFDCGELRKKMYYLEKPNPKTCSGCIHENYCRGCILKGWLMSQKMRYECQWAKKTNVNEIFNDWKKCK